MSSSSVNRPSRNRRVPEKLIAAGYQLSQDRPRKRSRDNEAGILVLVYDIVIIYSLYMVVIYTLAPPPCNDNCFGGARYPSNAFARRPGGTRSSSNAIARRCPCPSPTDAFARPGGSRPPDSSDTRCPSNKFIRHGPGGSCPPDSSGARCRYPYSSPSNAFARSSSQR
jgi:hypothetical protein